LIDTGRPNGSRSIMNTLNAHIDRSASHLFSPVDLRFVLDFESHYDRSVLAQGEITARVLTREWERKDIDVMFAEGVDISLRYGAAILKQMWGNAGLEAKLVMPWQFGVYREDMNNLDDQEAVCESGLMTLEEVWRRISHLPGKEKINPARPTYTIFSHRQWTTRSRGSILTTMRGKVRKTNQSAMKKERFIS